MPPGFLNPADAGPWSSWSCSMWIEDCPAGEKCAPYANDGGNSWNATRCVPIAPDPGQPGEPCTVEGPLTSGMDDCALHSMCWDIQEGQGTCRAFCIGSENYPSCADPSEYCFISGEGTTPLCLPTCDPLLQDCQDGFGCYATWDTYTCAPDASSGERGVGEPCEFLNACAAGLACVQGESCESPGCCMPFCSLSSPSCPEGSSCVPMFEDADVPLGAEDVGACAGAA
ncbi:MAG: ribulose phosphate epimerase [Myxococcota bacterium]